MQPHSANLSRQASAALAAQDYEQTKVLCEQILSIDRNDGHALLMLAQVHADRGYFDEASACVTRAVKAQPKNPQYRMNLGQLYAAQGQYPKALAQFEKAIKLDPDRLMAVAGKAAVLERQRKYDRAEKLLRPYLSAPAPDPALAAVAVRLLTRSDRLDDAVTLGHRVIESGASPSMALRDVCFALAKALERRGDHADAMRVAVTANELLAAPWDPARMEQRVDTLIEFYTPQRLAALPRPARADDRAVFVVGMPRCGSTLTERIIHAHPLAHGAGEITAFARIVDAMIERTGQPNPAGLAALDAGAMQELAGAYSVALDDHSPRGGRPTRVVNKELGNFVHVGLISVLLPEATIIHTRRNAVDTCLSCYFERLVPATAPWAADLEHLGRYYRQYERLMRHWQETLDLDVFEVEYEQLIAAPEDTTRAILDACGLPFDEACLRSHEARGADTTLSYDQVNKPIYASAIGRAARFGALLDPLRRALEPAS